MRQEGVTLLTHFRIFVHMPTNVHVFIQTLIDITPYTPYTLHSIHITPYPSPTPIWLTLGTSVGQCIAH